MINIDVRLIPDVQVWILNFLPIIVVHNSVVFLSSCYQSRPITNIQTWHSRTVVPGNSTVPMLQLSKASLSRWHARLACSAEPWTCYFHHTTGLAPKRYILAHVFTVTMHAASMAQGSFKWS